LILSDGHELILAGINNDKVVAHRVNGANKYFYASRDDSYALVMKLKNGKRPVGMSFTLGRRTYLNRAGR